MPPNFSFAEVPYPEVRVQHEPQEIFNYHHTYINLKLLAINSIVLTGGITKVLTVEEIQGIIAFFYRKILTSDHNPVAVLDGNYDIWTLGTKV